MSESIERNFEKIVGVALYDRDNDKIHSLTLSNNPEENSHQHSDLIKNLQAQKIDTERFIEGFITSYGNFMNRQEAISVAKSAGQISKNFDRFELTSLDLYAHMLRTSE